MGRITKVLAASATMLQAPGVTCAAVRGNCYIWTKKAQGPLSSIGNAVLAFEWRERMCWPKNCNATRARQRERCLGGGKGSNKMAFQAKCYFTMKHLAMRLAPLPIRISARGMLQFASSTRQRRQNRTTAVESPPRSGRHRYSTHARARWPEPRRGAH